MGQNFCVSLDGVDAPARVSAGDQMGQPMELVDLHESTQAALAHAGLVAQETAGGLSREKAQEALRNMMFVADAQVTPRAGKIRRAECGLGWKLPTAQGLPDGCRWMA